MKRALVVDDVAEVRSLIAAILERGKKFEAVDEVESAEEALLLFEPGKYHLVVMDIGLIQMSGVDAAYEMRLQDEDVFIVAVTGYGRIVEEADLSIAGFNAWFVKPVGYKRFLDFLDNLI